MACPLSLPGQPQLGMSTLRSLLAALGGVSIFYAAVASSHPDHARQSPLTSDAYTCEHPAYRVSIVSKSPLIVYLQDFITPSERAHLLQLGLAPLLLPS